MVKKQNLYSLKPNRMHEVCGPGAFWFASIHAANSDGPVFWVRERWRQEQLNPLGLLDVLPIRDVLRASTKTQIETLAVAEEALRSRSVGAVVMELNAPLDLTSGRRLQLAAKTGNTMGLAIISEGMGSNAAETRWRCHPVFDEKDSTLQRWELIKNKSGTLGVWNVRWSASSRRINVVSETGK